MGGGAIGGETGAKSEKSQTSKDDTLDLHWFPQCPPPPNSKSPGGVGVFCTVFDDGRPHAMSEPAPACPPPPPPSSSSSPPHCPPASPPAPPPSTGRLLPVAWLTSSSVTMRLPSVLTLLALCVATSYSYSTTQARRQAARGGGLESPA